MGDTTERIYLPRLPAFKENTFCVDQADTDTVEYIRADLHQKALDRIEELEAEVAEAREEGRRAGLEEAAKVADDHSAMIVTGKIRALRTSTPQEGEEP